MSFNPSGSMQYGSEHPSTLQQKQQWAANAANASADAYAMANQAREDGREMFERGMLQQEQKRRAYDSETQRSKFGVLAGLLGGARRMG